MLVNTANVFALIHIFGLFHNETNYKEDIIILLRRAHIYAVKHFSPINLKQQTVALWASMLAKA